MGATRKVKEPISIPLLSLSGRIRTYFKSSSVFLNEWHRKNRQHDFFSSHLSLRIANKTPIKIE